MKSFELGAASSRGSRLCLLLALTSACGDDDAASGTPGAGGATSSRAAATTSTSGEGGGDAAQGGASASSSTTSGDGGSGGGPGPGGSGGGGVVVEGGTVAVGQRHSCILDDQGRAACFGANDEQQLGDDGSTDSARPILVGDPTVVFVAISSAFDSTCALDEHGQRWCWGNGNFGDGNGANGYYFEPTLIDGGWRAISLTATGGCGLDEAGKLRCWGNDQIALGGETGVPVPMLGASTFRQVAVGEALFDPAVAAGIESGGQLGVWGFDSAGIASFYERVDEATDWVQVDVDADHFCAIKADGTLWCWGENELGQCGLGTFDPVAAPTRVGDATDWRAVRVGRFASCGVRSSGELYCWGWNHLGQAGVPITLDSAVVATPVRVAEDVAIDGFDISGVTVDLTNLEYAAPSGHGCARRTDGTHFCWGDGARGQLGNGFGGVIARPPNRVVPPVAFTEIAGASRLLAGDGTVWGFGVIAHQPVFQTSSAAADVDLCATDAVVLASGVAPGGLPNGGSRCVVYADGRLGCSVGTSGACSGTAATVCAQDFEPVDDATDWVRVTAAAFGACAIKSDGALYCWGSNSVGEVGDGTTDFRGSPTLVQGGASWIDVAVTGDTTCAIQEDQSLWCWGWFEGAAHLVPTLIDSDDDWLEVQPGCGRTVSGDASCWDVTVASFQDLGATTAVSGNGATSCVIRPDGTLWCVGSGLWGMLGDGAMGYSDVPVQVGTDADWIAVSVGDRSVCGVHEGGDLDCWGATDGRTGRPASFSDRPADVLAAEN